jgi:hypothetical protein
VNKEKIVAVAFLTESNMRAIGASLQRVYPIQDTPVFADLLQALDEADRARGGDKAACAC